MTVKLSATYLLRTEWNRPTLSLYNDNAPNYEFPNSVHIDDYLSSNTTLIPDSDKKFHYTILQTNFIKT